METKPSLIGIQNAQFYSELSFINLYKQISNYRTLLIHYICRMTPMDIQRALQLSFLSQLNCLSQLDHIRRSYQDCLLQQISRNYVFQEKLKIKYKNQYQNYSKDQVNQSQSLFQFNSFSESQYKAKKICKKKKIRTKNDTKNIPKNFGKAIITFIQGKLDVVRKVLMITGAVQEDFISMLKQKKKNLHSIAQLRELWLQQSFKYAKQMRIISLHFLRRSSLKYIFKSRISNYQGHIKYRKRFIDALKQPETFTYIKNEKPK